MDDRVGITESAALLQIPDDDPMGSNLLNLRDRRRISIDPEMTIRVFSCTCSVPLGPRHRTLFEPR